MGHGGWAGCRMSSEFCLVQAGQVQGDGGVGGAGGGEGQVLRSSEESVEAGGGRETLNLV